VSSKRGWIWTLSRRTRAGEPEREFEDVALAARQKFNTFNTFNTLSARSYSLAGLPLLNP
jgi:hypothetical protein